MTLEGTLLMVYIVIDTKAQLIGCGPARRKGVSVFLAYLLDCTFVLIVEKGTAAGSETFNCVVVSI